MDISDKTKVPLFAVLALTPIFFGAIFWLSYIYVSLENANAINVKQEDKIDDMRLLMIDVRDRLIRIESEVKYKKQKGGSYEGE